MNVELTGLDKTLAILHPDIYRKSLNRTVNDIGTKAKNQMVKGVRQKYNIRAGKLKDYIKWKRSRYSNMEYTLTINSKRRNVMGFGAKKLKKKGYVSVQIKKGQGRSTLRNSFTSKDGKAVLHRVGRTQQIKAVQTLSIPQMFNDKILKEADDMVMKDFGKSFQGNFNFYIGNI